MTSVPKPLKFLRPHYGKLKEIYDGMAPGENKVSIGVLHQWIYGPFLPQKLGFIFLVPYKNAYLKVLMLLSVSVWNCHLKVDIEFSFILQVRHLI